ncbi:probable calcium-binding protein CML10 [Lingula anatina]|uniref:Probable calcium-binding protein CML10 n=1 Tax=Lingula anatina TaxID=7574 RepID=A0A1S3HSE3_LINAN|nr:probable calcium-binding protein CML10 [Lingula anatina]|eukprot:XP_013388466.1 probable calcium-binding protein CML10 [Lingula anatina]
MDKEQFEAFFKEADSDQNGTLSLCELCGILRKKGYRGKDEEIKKYFESVDTSGDGQISLEEYMVAMGLVPPVHHKAAMFRGVFQQFDKNGDGKIDKHELKACLAELGRNYTEEETARWLAQIEDKDGDTETMNYEEFIKEVFGVDV